MRPLPSTGKAIADILEELHDAMWELEADEKAEHIRYTEADVIHALKIFMHVASNKYIHDSMENGEPMRKAMDAHENHGKRLRQLTIDMAGIDPVEFYKT